MVGTLDFAMNFPVLLGSNMLQFNKQFFKGFGTQKGFMNNLKNSTKAAFGGQTEMAIAKSGRIVAKDAANILKGVETKGGFLRGVKDFGGAAIKGVMSEGNEEMLQQAATYASQYIGNERMQNASLQNKSTFYGYRFDPEADEKQKGILGNIFKGI
jgi:hypothetical protein